MHLPVPRRRLRADLRRGTVVGHACRVGRLLRGTVKRLTAIPAPDGLAVHVERLGELDLTSLATLTRSLTQVEERARPSSVRAIRFTSSRVSASSSLSAASSTACAVDASGARTRSLTVVSVSSAMRRSRGSDGVVTPRSQRDTVIDSTPKLRRKLFLGQADAAPRNAQSPPHSAAFVGPTKQGVDNRLVGRTRRDRLTPTSAIGEPHALPAALAALVALGEEERTTAARQLVPEEPTADRHSSGPTCTSIFPMFSPRSRPRNAFGAFSMPSTTVSR